jgi:uncharacterized membrane protein YedE/YeeE
MDAVIDGSGYWPWWLGAFALAGIATFHFGVLGRAFGISGVFAKVLNWSQESEAAAAEAKASDPAAVHAAMAAETLAMIETMDAESLGMSEEEFATFVEEQRAEALKPPPPVEPSGVAIRPPPHASVFFLGALVVGGFVAALSSGRFSLQFSPDAAYAELLAGGAVPWVALAIGGLLVGVGTQMAGGCSAGHGLNGCAALQKGSLAATATFFGTGVVTSMLMGVML